MGGRQGRPEPPGLYPLVLQGQQGENQSTCNKSNEEAGSGDLHAFPCPFLHAGEDVKANLNKLKTGNRAQGTKQRNKVTKYSGDGFQDPLQHQQHRSVGDLEADPTASVIDQL